MKFQISLGKGSLPLLFSYLLMVLCLAGCAEDSNILDNGQSQQLEFSVTTQGWDNSDKSSNQKVPSRATPITGNTFDTSKSFNVIADVNKGSSWFTEVNKETVSYSTANKIWQTTATHYWPGKGSTMDFYAYYPTNISGSITHTTGSAPVLSYTVPDNATNQIDILASSSTGIAGDSYNQTPVDFKHILAAVQFCVGSGGMINGTITKISLNGIQNIGSYNFTSGWTPQTSSTTTYTKNVSAASDAGTEIVSGNDPFLVMPQTLSNASFTITYSGGATLTKSLNGIWEVGKVYDYNINSSFSATQDFSYTGDVQSYTIPFTGTYKIQCWGASGGDLNIYVGGKGAYTNGNIQLNKNQVLYIYIGEQGGKTAIVSTPFNSGSSQVDNGQEWQWGRAGGGATDIRLISGKWNNFESLKSRIMVAAGGGGADNRNSTEIGNTIGPYYGDGNGGYGGSLTGGSGTTENHTNPLNNLTGGYSTDTGATQTAGGYLTEYYPYTNNGYEGGFGYSNGSVQAGGGGGYYGGASAFHCGASGGSSFISGYPGCNAISELSTSTNIIHTGSPDHYSGYVFTNMEMIAGDSSMPAPSGGTEKGHPGNGYARITFVSAN
jgi:hypothetical protein